MGLSRKRLMAKKLPQQCGQMMKKGFSNFFQKLPKNEPQNFRKLMFIKIGQKVTYDLGHLWENFFITLYQSSNFLENSVAKSLRIELPSSATVKVIEGHFSTLASIYWNRIFMLRLKRFQVTLVTPKRERVSSFECNEYFSHGSLKYLVGICSSGGLLCLWNAKTI